VLLLAALGDDRGWGLLSRLRADSDVPIVVLTNASPDERARALELGADDCLSDMCHSRELAARIQAVLRRAAPRSELAERRLDVDVAARQVRLNGRVLDLRPAEFDLLATLAVRPGVVFARDALRGSAQSERTVEARVRAIRVQLRDTGMDIVAVHRSGYKLRSSADARPFYSRTMPSLVQTLGDDLKDAMRAGDSVRRDEIRGLLAALNAESQSKLTRQLSQAGLIVPGDDATLTAEQQADVARLRAGSALTPDEEQAVVRQRARQHQQSIDGFQKGGRTDLEQIERAQLAVLGHYLPQAMDAGEIEAAIRTAIFETGASTIRDLGKVMSKLSPQLRGRADMKAVNARVQELLSGSGVG
jgi:uncharacterized protein YqeY/DNA-binding response OmpR family regulator